LFSDHYLGVTLPERPVMEEISRVFDSYAPSHNEAQTEEDLVRPVLRLLDHDFEVQALLEPPDGMKRPDYVFYRDLAEREQEPDAERRVAAWRRLRCRRREILG
jgi:hypothetical protein